MDNEAPETAASTSCEPLPATRVLTEIVYCGACTVPPEYCEYGATQNNCKQWLADNHPDMFTRIYPGSALEVKIQDMSMKDSAAGTSPDGEPSDGKKKSADGKAEKTKRKKATEKVIIKRVERTKRKCVIAVTGLEHFDVDLKKAAKSFAQKFACGSSVTKNPTGQDEIVVQGDVQNEIYDYILENYPQVSEDRVDVIEK
ncbi:hypothetical protein SeMB42_g01630 [Synchytrium endobioticum]|uniref:Translation machinery-associated protein 22 n=1 Tax=Synchytrium endobioticum TaxID=286115 RepID=A0A507DMM4_9FUNG|nr:hypothetical protein SeLEV6574_g00357 [Synchytrium endobioticum]TPX52140.1 hypothetical protein SeMB42_g01630 [Synchytrium endobioticum]